MLLPTEAQVGVRPATRFACEVLIASIARPSAADLARQWPSIFDGRETVFHFEANDTCPQAMIVFNPPTYTQSLVCVQGVSRNSHNVEIVSGWALPPLLPFRLSRAYTHSAFRFDAELPLDVLVNGTDQWYVGHSWGGAIARTWAAFHQAAQPNLRRHVYTFGEPAATPAPRIPGLWRPLLGQRCMLVGDPIPALPPTLPELGMMLALVSDAAAINMASIDHNSLGVIINNPSTPWLRAQTSAPVPPILAFQSLAQWLHDALANYQATHSLQSYMAAINASADAIPIVPDREAPALPSPRAPTPNQVQTAREAAVIQNSVVNQQNPMQAVAGAIGQITIVPGLRFHRHTIRGRRTITYAGVLVCYVKTRREQVSLARWLNRWLDAGGMQLPPELQFNPLR